MEDELKTSHQEMGNLAAAYWGKVWHERAPRSDEERNDFLRLYNKKIGEIFLPSIKDIAGTIKSNKNTTPGPDGVPFAAWRSNTDISAPVLHRVLTALANGDKPPKHYNLGLLFLLPNMIEDTRPLCHQH